MTLEFIQAVSKTNFRCINKTFENNDSFFTKHKYFLVRRTDSLKSWINEKKGNVCAGVHNYSYVTFLRVIIHFYFIKLTSAISMLIIKPVFETVRLKILSDLFFFVRNWYAAGESKRSSGAAWVTYRGKLRRINGHKSNDRNDKKKFVMLLCTFERRV